MASISPKLRNLLLGAVILIGLGVLISSFGFASVKNDIEDLKIEKNKMWYQTIHLTDDNQLTIGVHLGPLQIASFQ
ncbi:hypothetical protein [Anaerorhabdus sp.]|uniref:hypothetical protein n=1 Tax=Anaerorhabdus sp. TaxID=1872524 RepID=UPI002FC74078